jgi:hypothetical protein
MAADVFDTVMPNEMHFLNVMLMDRRLDMMGHVFGMDFVAEAGVEPSSLR